MVIDGSNGKKLRIPKSIYYNIGKIVKIFRYNYKLVMLYVGRYDSCDVKINLQEVFVLWVI